MRLVVERNRLCVAMVLPSFHCVTNTVLVRMVTKSAITRLEAVSGRVLQLSSYFRTPRNIVNTGVSHVRRYKHDVSYKRTYPSNSSNVSARRQCFDVEF
jgi:hypothetical protein